MRVQRVQKVLPAGSGQVQRVMVLPLRGNEYICRLSAAVIAQLTFPPDTVMLSPGEEWSVDQLKGKPFYGQVKGQLWSTRASYAECAQYLPIVSHERVNTGRREEDSDVVKILKVLKFDSHFVAEGCGIALGHALTGVRVQRVQRVLPAGSGQVQRVVVLPLRGNEYICRLSAAYKIHRREAAIPSPLNPLNHLNLLNPLAVGNTVSTANDT